MKKLADTAYWIFAAGTTGSIALSAYVFTRLHSAPEVHVAPQLGPFSTVQLSMLAMAATLLFGLFFVMPVLRKRQIDQDLLTNRTAELEVAVVTDPLTGLYNRRYFEDALAEYLNEFNNIGAPLALLTLDLDHFKSVNDTHGHDVGDEVLKQLAKNLKNLTRDHDIVARTGGEEFCIVAPFPDPAQILPFAERVCKMVSSMKIEVDGKLIPQTVSIGVASTADGLKKPKALVKLSDQRLYQAKANGRNQVCG